MKTLATAPATIYRTQPADWPQLSSEVLLLEHANFDKYICHTPRDLAELFNDRGVNLVAEQTSGYVGYIASKPIDKEIYLASICVLPQARNLKLGTKLLELFFSESEKEGFTTTSMHATTPKIKNLASRMGFEELHEIKNWCGTNSPAWYLEKSLV